MLDIQKQIHEQLTEAFKPVAKAIDADVYRQLTLGKATMTQTDQMNELNDLEHGWPYDSHSTRVSEEQTQQRERLQEDIEGAFERVITSAYVTTQYYSKTETDIFDNDIRLLRWALGVK